MRKLLKRQQVKDWLESPVTLKFLGLIHEHLEANEESLSGIVKHSLNIKDKVEDLAQIKGQIFTLELIKNLEEFLEEEIIDDEVHTDKIELHSSNNEA